MINYTMPAEWEKHSAVWLAWPYDKISFGSLNEPGEKFNPARLPKVEQVFLKIIDALAGSEQVNLIVRDKKHSHILENVRMFEADYADIWTRDYLPCFLDEKTAIKWQYNAYGSKFPGLLKDNEVWESLQTNITTIKRPLLLEPGAIEVNGQGVLMTTDQCLLTRNPNLAKPEIEKELNNYLGAKKIIWLKEGLVNDHTDGHIDEIARFVAPNKIVCAYEDDQSDENYNTLDANYRALAHATDATGKPFEVIKLPMPHMNYNDGKKAPASYCNFYIGNKVVLAAIFNDPNDQKALEILQSVFPDRKIVPIDCTDLIYGGGAIHCMTQQVPAV
jgi:agmatine deiminase